MNILLRTIALPLCVLAGATAFSGAAFAMDAKADCAKPHDAMSADAMKSTDAMAATDAMKPADAMKTDDAMKTGDAMAATDTMKPADPADAQMKSDDAMATGAMKADAMKTDCPT